ncbi:YcaO-like family protein [Streptomyces orinoci]|uniref:YcaO-like family protein n=1 Tax=Streptomyces orinoci TaxID=67339 RepID=A0ABV3K5E8_STRON|nr:YcaO-like family protein [Streptomyces orinoci]
MAQTPAVRCALRGACYRSYPSSRTVTVRCTLVAASGGAQADGYGTGETMALARRKALSEAVERLLACSPFALSARPPVARAGSGAVRSPLSGGVRTIPGGCRMRWYHSLTGEATEPVPMYWSSPWVADLELRSAVLAPGQARLSSTVGWAVAPDPALALRRALFELTELLNYGAFLYRSLTGPRPAEAAGEGAGEGGGETVGEGAGAELIPIAFATRTPTVLALARHPGRVMPATGLGSAPTTAEATDRALLELAQAEALWRANRSAGADERLFVRRFDRWPLLRRCVTLHLAPAAAEVPPGSVPRPSPLPELTARSIAVWADHGAIDLSGPGIRAERLHFAHVVSRPQPLLGLVRSGVPVFDTKEVRKVLDRARLSADHPLADHPPADSPPAGRHRAQGRPAGT